MQTHYRIVAEYAILDPERYWNKAFSFIDEKGETD